MEEIIQDIQDFLLEFQNTYDAKNPQLAENLPNLTLIYDTPHSWDMHRDIYNSVTLRNRLKQRNVTLTYLVSTDHSLIIECRLPDAP